MAEESDAAEGRGGNRTARPGKPSLASRERSFRFVKFSDREVAWQSR